MRCASLEGVTNVPPTVPEHTAQGSLTIAQELGELSEQLRVSMSRFKVG